MASGHQDVDLPRSTWHRAGTFLVDFGEFVRGLGFHTWTVQKEPGGHLTSFWLYAVLDAHCSKRSKVQFGCTQFASVNPNIHAYARGKAPHLTTAVDLLEHFVQRVWAFEEQAAAPGQTTAMQAQHQAWDQFEVLDMGQYRCPTTERLWYSNDDASVWFMPDADGRRSICGNWQVARQDHGGVWWINETSRQLMFLAAA